MAKVFVCVADEKDGVVEGKLNILSRQRVVERGNSMGNSLSWPTRRKGELR